MLDQLIGGRQGRQGGAENAQGFSLDQLLTGPGGLATGAAAGGLAAMLMGGAKPKKLAKNALKVGGVALVGGLAYKAWRDWQGNRPPAQNNAYDTTISSPIRTAFIPEEEDHRRSLARSLMRAMVAAAKADGHMTTDEKARILEQLQSTDVDEYDRALIAQELERPIDVEAIVRDAATPEMAAELYTASLLVIDPEGAAERGYLAMLAARLRLEPDLVAHIHANAVPSGARAAA